MLFCYRKYATLCYFLIAIDWLICTLFLFPRSFRNIWTGADTYKVGFIHPIPTDDFSSALIGYLLPLLAIMVVIIFVLDSLAKNRFAKVKKDFLNSGDATLYLSEINEVQSNLRKQFLFSKKEKELLCNSLNIVNDKSVSALFEAGKLEQGFRMGEKLLQNKAMSLKIATPAFCEVCLLMQHWYHVLGKDKLSDAYRVKIISRCSSANGKINQAIHQHYLDACSAVEDFHRCSNQDALALCLKLKDTAKANLDLMHILCYLAILEHRLGNRESANAYLTEAKALCPTSYSVTQTAKLLH